MNGILGIQREADRQAMERDAMNMRGGMLRQDPGLMQRIGGAVADYAVPDRYLPSSVMEPRLDMNQLESLRGTPVDMADAPDPVPLLMDTMPMAGITVWHGSPHKFSKFDMSKIGTGEGAQAYGHGLYMAENPKVAKEYADELTREIKVGENIIQGKDKTIGTTGIEDVDDYLIADRGDARLALSNMKKDRLEIANSRYPENAKSYDAGIEMLEGLVKRGEVQNTTAGNLYKVDIPDDQIAKMLDWDKPLSEQGEGIKKPLEELLGRPYMEVANRRDQLERYADFLVDKYWQKGDKAPIDAIRRSSGAVQKKFKSIARELDSLDSGIGSTGERAYRELTRRFGDSKASAVLQGKSIPGIKYLDGGSRSGGQGTSNFVLFDDQIPQILEINDKPVRGVLGGQ